MPIGDNMQYVLATSSGRHINVFRDEGQGICASVLNKRNRWAMPQVIVRNCLPWISACLDESDDLHIAFQDLRGDIVHMFHRNGTWQRNTILQAKRPAKYNKHIYMVCEGNNTVLFYVVKHGEDSILSFQIADENGLAGKPQALDYIDPGEDAYVLFRAGSRVCLGYGRAADGKILPGYRWFDLEKGKAFEFKNLPDEDERLGALLVETRDIIHFCVIRKTDSGHAIYHLSRDEKKGEWANKTLLAESRLPFEIPAFHLSEGRLVCFWTQGKHAKGCKSLDGGKTWDGLQDHALDSRSGIHLASYADSHSRTFFSSQFNRVFCRFSNGLKIIYGNDGEFNGISGDKAVAEGSILKKFKSLLNENEELKRRLQNAEETLFSLEKKISTYGIELEKLRIEKEQL